MSSLSIIHENILIIENNYYGVKSRIQENLSDFPDLYGFDDTNNQVKYKTEGPLIPADNGKMPVLILLSNPHPHSVRQGMILSPNRAGIENPFWSTMRQSGFFTDKGEINAAAMMQNHYESPFRFFMAVLLPFPSDDPADLKQIFGHREYNKMLREGQESIKTLILDYGIRHIVCFSKLPYNAVSSGKSPKSYTTVLQNGDMILSSSWCAKDVKAFLTFPTGWRFIKNFREAKASSLRDIFWLITNDY